MGPLPPRRAVRARSRPTLRRARRGPARPGLASPLLSPPRGPRPPPLPALRAGAASAAQPHAPPRCGEPRARCASGPLVPLFYTHVTDIIFYFIFDSSSSFGRRRRRGGGGRCGSGRRRGRCVGRGAGPLRGVRGSAGGAGRGGRLCGAAAGGRAGAGGEAARRGVRFAAGVWAGGCQVVTRCGALYCGSAGLRNNAGTERRSPFAAVKRVALVAFIRCFDGFSCT